MFLRLFKGEPAFDDATTALKIESDDLVCHRFRSMFAMPVLSVYARSYPEPPVTPVR